MMRCRANFFRHAGESGYQCLVCPNMCSIQKGKRGRCGAFQSGDDGLYSTVYGKTSSLCIDPVEKKPLNHFLPGTPTLSIGTVGCNLSCSFCQNWDISLNRQREASMRDVSPEALVNVAKENGCKSIACTYNEPTIFIDYCLDIAAKAHESNLKMIAVTNGYIIGAAREQFFEAFDAANVDLKAFTEDFYASHCRARLQPVLDTLIYIRERTDVWLEITTLLIPGENDSEGELSRMFTWIIDNLGPSTPIHLTAFYPQYKMLDKQPTPPASLIRAREQAMAMGLDFVYTGNIYYPEGEITRCPQCKTTVISRDRYVMDAWNIANGACIACGQKVPGLFEEKPGSWGSQRQPV